MFKLVPILLSALFFSCKQTQEKIDIRNDPATVSVIKNEKSAQLNCEEVLMEIIKSSNLKSIKVFSDWKFRIDEKTSEKFLLKIYTENNLSDDPSKKQIVENAVSWLEFYPNNSKLFDITVDPENPQELNFDKSISQQNKIFEICGVVSIEAHKENIRETECKKITNEMLSGEECIFYNTTIDQEYLNLIKNKQIDDSNFLQKNLPEKSLKQKINKSGLNEIEYIVSTNSIKILFYYDGGETTLELQKKNDFVLRKILYSFD